jgi:hypothetical protein
MDEMSTNEVFGMFGYYRNTDNLHGDEIYNPYVPKGNQYTVEYHNSLVDDGKKRIDDESFKRPIRIDYHTGDTAQFMAFCDEMHINCDNDTSGAEFHNRSAYPKFVEKLNYIKSLSFFGRMSSHEFYTWELPRKHKYMVLYNGELTVKVEYVGITLSEEEIKEIEKIRANRNFYR